MGELLAFGRIRPILMKCGHASNAEITRMGQGDDKPPLVFDPPAPYCAICDCLETVKEPKPDLSGRWARCFYATETTGRHSLVPSDYRLPFFEYQGPDAERSRRVCKHCGYYDTAHDKLGRHPDYDKYICDHFEPRGARPEDTYYCGCKGWD